MSDKLVSSSTGQGDIESLSCTYQASTSKRVLLTFRELKRKASRSSGAQCHRVMVRKDKHSMYNSTNFPVNPPYGGFECHLLTYQKRPTGHGKASELIHVCCHRAWEAQESWRWGEWVCQQRQKESPGRSCLINHRPSDAFSRTSLRGLNDPPQQC